MNPMSDSALVVMESGSEWPAWIDECQASGARTIAQDDAESPGDLARRVGDVAAALGDGECPVQMAVIACNERIDAAAQSARRRAATALLSAMASRGAGRLLFSVNRRASGRARHAISALASDLAESWGEYGVLVSVRFGRGVPEPLEAATEAHVA